MAETKDQDDEIMWESDNENSYKVDESELKTGFDYSGIPIVEDEPNFIFIIDTHGFILDEVIIDPTLYKDITIFKKNQNEINQNEINQNEINQNKIKDKFVL